MKTFNQQAAQGDTLITQIDNIPDGLIEMKPENGQFVIAHSETQHHHVLPSRGVQAYHNPQNPMIMFVVVKRDYADLKHLRSFDTHETLRLKEGAYEIRRQREYTPEGWRRIED